MFNEKIKTANQNIQKQEQLSKQTLKQFTERLKTNEIDSQQFHDKQKKYVCQMIINKWVNKNILFGFNKWKKYSTMMVISKYEKELNQSKSPK